jgi:hypothetical protein
MVPFEALKLFIQEIWDAKREGMIKIAKHTRSYL